MPTQKTVTIAVIGKLDNGEVFFDASNEKPLTVQLGNNDLPPSVESVIDTMSVGEMRKVRVTPEEGYGARQKDLLQTIDSEEMVKNLKPVPGMLLTLRAEKDGVEQNIPATVIEVNGTEVTVDYNHPLAGHSLTYDIVVLDIK